MISLAVSLVGFIWLVLAKFDLWFGVNSRTAFEFPLPLRRNKYLRQKYADHRQENLLDKHVTCR